MKSQLIIVTGCAGSGKTTIGKELAKQLGYAFIDKDTVVNEFTDFALIKFESSISRESDFYKNELRPIEYKTTFDVCKEILDCNCGVVLVIPFIAQIQDYSKWLEIKNASNIDAKVKFIWIKHNINNERQHIIKRNEVRDKYKLEHWDEYAKSIENIRPSLEYNAYEYSNIKHVSDGIDEIIKEVRT